MSTLTKVLERNIKVIEKNADLTEGRFRLGHHLMPPVGWLNDPNGLCWYKGKYHVFFQYAPFDVEGGLKFWGHYTSEDLVDWKYEGTALYPDSPYDCHGVYSGSALAESEKLHLFFTGNVKIDGDYDYINEGRETSTLHVESEDGIHFGDKEEIISFEKYPEEFTCHIRDPKVWKENDRYFMVLGGRLKGDKGAVLVYESENLKEWKFKHIITTPEAFGYMWECPDYFELDGKKFLSVSPQGLKREEFRFQNIYQSGYFPVKEDGSVDERDFREWDMGFDFYAPQTFTDNSGRRLLIGWMGMPDVCFFRAGIRKLYRIIPEMESIDSCIALCYCKERFTVISLYADNQIIFSIQLNSTGVHHCIDSETFLEIGVCLRVQVISPFNRCKLSCQYRIFITVINSIIKICFLIFSCDQFFYFRFFNVILFIQHFSSSLLLPYTYVRCDTGISMVLQ